jgi:hypothetical protein
MTVLLSVYGVATRDVQNCALLPVAPRPASDAAGGCECLLVSKRTVDLTGFVVSFPFTAVCLDQIQRVQRDAPFAPSAGDRCCSHGLVAESLQTIKWWALATTACFGDPSEADIGVAEVRRVRLSTTLLPRCHTSIVQLREWVEPPCAILLSKIVPQLLVELLMGDKQNRNLAVYDAQPDGERACAVLSATAQCRLGVVYVALVQTEAFARELEKAIRLHADELQHLLFPGWFLALLIVQPAIS